MPIIERSSYRPPPGFRNGHIQTIYPNLFRRVNGIVYHRERIQTDDNDFLDLDWSCVNSNRIAILSHGLEGNTQRTYMLGMSKSLNNNGWDAVAWNFRGCSGEINKQLQFYHSGFTEDLHRIVRHVAGQDRYREIALIGFSMGGNLTIKYLGEQKELLISKVKKAVAFSVPCDLQGSAEAMARWRNRIYMSRFLRMLREKVRAKELQMPGEISSKGFGKIRNFRQFDDRYTAPLHGFENAIDYWTKASCRQFIPDIRIPTLLVNALDDPFLSLKCYPYEEAKSHSDFVMETPSSGGHVGFVTFNSDGSYWNEKRTIEFLQQSPP